jgi:hypothetical protein
VDKSSGAACDKLEDKITVGAPRITRCGAKRGGVQLDRRRGRD